MTLSQQNYANGTELHAELNERHGPHNLDLRQGKMQRIFSRRDCLIALSSLLYGAQAWRGNAWAQVHDGSDAERLYEVWSERKAAADEILYESSACLALRDWLEQRASTIERRTPAFEFLQSILGLIRISSDSRQRFVIPRSNGLARRNLPAWEQAISTLESKKQFRDLLTAYLQSLLDALQDDTNSGRGAIRFGEANSSRIRLFGASLASFLPASEASEMQGEFNHSAIHSIQSLRRTSDPRASNRQRSTIKATHPITGWPASSYQLVQTEHFDIAMQGRGRPSLELAELCEQVYAVWAQLFYPYWRTESGTASGTVHSLQIDEPKRQFDAPENFSDSTSRWLPPTMPSAHEPFQVVVFANKANYVKALEKQVPNIAASVGYYNPNVNAAFLYIEPGKNYATLVHELTHQFFYEVHREHQVSREHQVHIEQQHSGVQRQSGSYSFDTDETAGFWLAEGIALYMESMSFRDLGPVTLLDVGGWDSPRLQASRFRMLYEGIWFPWSEFSRANGVRFRDPRDLGARYSQASGLTHYFLEGKSANPPSLMKQIDALYSGGQTQLYERSFSDDQLLEDYIQFAKHPVIDSGNYLSFTNRDELVLPRCNVDFGQFGKVLESRTNWKAIDLAFTSCDDTFIASVADDIEIQRLNLESTLITDGAMPRLASIGKLQELDLSQCPITSSGISSLRRNSTLKVLWLVQTQVDDDALEVLASISNLTVLHARGCRISNEAWEQLLVRNPKLKKGSTPP